MFTLFNKRSKNINLKLHSNFDITPHFTQNLLHISFWQKLKLWIFPYLKESENLTRQYFEAEIKQKQNNANKTEAETNLLKIKGIREYNSIINEIFSDDGLPEEAKALKLTKLLENNNDSIAMLKSAIENTVNHH